MADFEQAIEQAIAAEDIPGCTLHATNRDGTFTYAKAFGRRTMKPGDTSPLTLTNTMWIASCTKLMTSICAMQLVERGHLTLDAPVYTHIPELRARPVILDISSDGTPVEEPHKNPITLRTLLTHSSGLCYDGLHPKLDAWMEHRGLKPSTAGTILERFNRPLIFEPGTSWSYGPGIDFAGLLVERVSGKSLEEYMKENLWGPLGITDMTFSLGRRPDLKERMAGKALRDEETGKVVYSDERDQWEVEKGVEVQDCFGGQGVFTYGGEYIKVLRAVLTTDEDEKILKRESVELFFSPQLGDQSREMLNMVLTNEVAQNAMGGVPTEVKKDYGLGGLLILEDAPDGKKAGTMFWGGLPNLTWFVDRKTGLAGLYSGQVIPPGDAKVAALQRKWEAGIIEKYRQSKSVSARI